MLTHRENTAVTARFGIPFRLKEARTFLGGGKTVSPRAHALALLLATGVRISEAPAANFGELAIHRVA